MKLLPLLQYYAGCLFLLFSFSSIAQVGIGTTNPQTGLHIAGATNNVRIEALNNTNNATNNGVDASPIYVDSNGDLTLDGPLVIDKMPINRTGVSGTGVRIGDVSGAVATGTVYSTTLTLTQDALVEVVIEMYINLYQDSSNTPITDREPRWYGLLVYINGGECVWTESTYTSSNTGSTFSFRLNGNGYLTLSGSPTGTVHSIDVIGYVIGNGASTFGLFGTNPFDKLQVILH